MFDAYAERNMKEMIHGNESNISVLLDDYFMAQHW